MPIQQILQKAILIQTFTNDTTLPWKDWKELDWLRRSQFSSTFIRHSPIIEIFPHTIMHLPLPISTSCNLPELRIHHCRRIVDAAHLTRPGWVICICECPGVLCPVLVCEWSFLVVWQNTPSMASAHSPERFRFHQLQGSFYTYM